MSTCTTCHTEHELDAPCPSEIATQSQTIDATEKNWATLGHASAFLGAFILIAVSGPFVVWLLKEKYGAFALRHTMEALNFNISMTLYLAISFALTPVLIGFVMLPIVGLMWVIFPIMAAVKASNGEEYRYPVTLRLVS